MKLQFLLLTSAIFISSFLSAQSFSKKLGEIGLEEINLVKYDKDPDASAIILFDIGDSRFIESTEGGYDIEFVQQKRIKILENSGKDYAEIEIPYYVDGYGKTEIVKSIKAFSYNVVNGSLQKTQIDPSAIYDEIQSKKWRVKKFAFPNVSKGTIIEYSYTIESPFLFQFRNWVFQNDIPTIYSQYTARMIPFYTYTFIAQGISKFDYQNSFVDSQERSWGTIKFKDYIYTYALKDIPAFKDESYITSINDYVMKIDFQLSKINSPTGYSEDILTTWPKLIEALYKEDNFGKYISKGKKLAQKILLSELTPDLTDQEKTAQQIIDYVKTAFTWNGSYTHFATKQPKEMVTGKNGTSADINLFLVSMLQEAGINALPVILSTRNHGKIRQDFPFDHYFNHVIVLIKTEDKKFLADATEPLIAYNRIPPHCLNGEGLVVEEKTDGAWINLNISLSSAESYFFNVDVVPDSSIANIQLNAKFSEYEAYVMRDRYKDDSIKIKSMLKDRGFSEIHSVVTANFQTPEKNYNLITKGQAPIEFIDSQLIIQPFLNFPIREYILKQATRVYPVDFTFSFSEVYISKINIPNGYSLVGFPKNFVLNNELINLTISTRNEENSVYVNSSFTMKKAVYQPNDYLTLKNCLNTVVKKLNEVVMFEKTDHSVTSSSSSSSETNSSK